MSVDPEVTRPRPTGEVAAPTPGLTIEVVSGVGFGPTKLAAFDAALREAGIADCNLLFLTSIIPSGSRVITTDRPAAADRVWGDRLYVVMSELRIDTRNEEAVAGIGWVQEEGSGRGLFVEHVGHTEREVRRDILATLGSVCAGRPELRFPAPEVQLRTTVCAGEPTCALVAAVYRSEPWTGPELRLP